MVYVKEICNVEHLKHVVLFFWKVVTFNSFNSQDTRLRRFNSQDCDLESDKQQQKEQNLM